ncbi:Uncharacterised protein [uncultured archaeon]|nr:Uncharacterised protein [uncultured archaeon]
MTELTEGTIKETFGDKTFYKGLDYYDGKRVLDTVRIGSALYAQVLGSSAKPYEVTASINEMHTECSCPVGSMCKHGVALLLKWIHEPSSFIDADKFLLSLEKMSKSEIIGIIEKIIKQNPSLINEFYIEKEEKPEINIDAISEKIGWIVHGELDYYSIDDAIGSLEEIKSIADRLKEKGSCKNAADIYLALVKGGMTAYEEGADDSDGGLGDLVIQCVTDFNECMEKIDDVSYKNRLLERILGIVEEEDYGLETEEMLYGIVTDENIRRIEEYLLEKLKEKRKSASDFSYTYKKEDTLELLIGLYGKLGKPGEKLRLARYELTEKEDYARLANVLLEENKIEEAFDTVKKGLMLSGETLSELNELYFTLAERLIQKKPDLVDFKTSLSVALEMFSREFDKEEYEIVKKVFSGIGGLEEYKSAMRKDLKNRDSAMRALLHDGELKSAIDMVRTEPGISSRLIIDVARAAMEKNMIGESALLTRMVLERGWADDRPPVKELLNSMVKASDTGTLEELCKHISKKGSSGTAILLIPRFMKKAPELSGMLARNFINAMPVELVIKVAGEVARKAPEEGVSLCRLRINKDILRSHVHYDKAVLLLGVIRDIYEAKGNKAKWTEFIRRFAAENRGKKRLIEMVRKEFGVV